MKDLEHGSSEIGGRGGGTDWGLFFFGFLMGFLFGVFSFLGLLVCCEDKRKLRSYGMGTAGGFVLSIVIVVFFVLLSGATH
jgi:hypothetical protein